MRIINDYPITESFLGNKLLNAQLDSFRVYSIELQLNFLADSDRGKQSYWFCITSDVSFYSDKGDSRNRSEVIANLYELIGRKVSAVRIENTGMLSLCFESKVITVRTDDDKFEVIWSVTPESPDLYTKHDWSVVLTDDLTLVLLLEEAPET